MKKNKKRLLAGAMASLFIWNTWGWQPQAMAGSSVYRIEEVRELPESVLYQEVAYGTKYRDLNLPDKLKVLVTKEEAEENDEEEQTAGVEKEERETEKKATPSEMTGAGPEYPDMTLSKPERENKTLGQAIEIRTEEKADKAERVSEEVSGKDETDGAAKIATPSEIDSSQSSDSSQTDSNWKEVKVRWVLDETFSEKTKYDGKTPGVYVFDAELKNSRYELEEGFLPRIEITVLPEETDPMEAKLLAPEEENGIALLEEDAEPLAGAETVSVEISWGERMDFTYWDGPWDTTTHTYRSGSWKPTVSSNWIKVKNGGNTEVKVEYSFSTEKASEAVKQDSDLSQWLNGLSGNFTKDAAGKGEPINSQTLHVGGAEQTVYLNLSSEQPPKALSDTNGVKLGTATVRISSSSSLPD